MASFKPLLPVIIDSDDEIVSSLNTVMFHVLKWTGYTGGITQINFNITGTIPDLSRFEALTEEYEDNGNAIPDNFTESWYLNKLLPFSPLSLRREIKQYAGYRLKLLNVQSGYYAVSVNNIGNSGLVSGYYNLYTNHNELIGTVSGNDLAFPFSYDVGARTLVTGLDDNGNIANVSYRRYQVGFLQGTEASNSLTISTTNTATIPSAFILWFNALENAIQPTGDPFGPGGTSETGGGDGTFGDDRFGDGIDDEAIDIPDYDSTEELDRSIRGTGFVNIYTASKTELQNFANYLWTTPTLGDLLKRMYSNPFDAIVSLHMIPVTVGGTPGNIFIGGQDSGVSSSRVNAQYVTVSCGSMHIGEYWDAYLDYSPYTKLYVYLPFCGMHEVDVDEFMGKSMAIRYDVDIVTGDCLASISVVDGLMTRVLYQYQGNCSVEIPVSGENYNAKVSAYMGLIGTAFGIGAGVASGGMSAAAGAGAALAGALNVVNAKGSIQRSGALSGSTAWMSTLKPYLILVQPTQCLPDDQNKFTGYPSYITAAVGDLTGYTEFEEIHLSGISATDEEKAEIERILKEGVLL